MRLNELETELKFYNGITDSYDDELFGNVIAYVDSMYDENDRYISDNIRGVLEYGIYDNEINIKHIEVKDQFRKQGIATAMLDKLKDDNQGMKMDWGMMTPDGIELYKKYNNTETIEEKLDFRLSEFDDDETVPVFKNSSRSEMLGLFNRSLESAIRVLGYGENYWIWDAGELTHDKVSRYLKNYDSVDGVMWKFTMKKTKDGYTVHDDEDGNMLIVTKKHWKNASNRFLKSFENSKIKFIKSDEHWKGLT